VSSQLISVLDAGSSSVRALVIDTEGRVVRQAGRPTPPSTPAPGMVEIDGAAMVSAARQCLDEVGTCDAAALGITTQRATTMLWDKSTGAEVAPGLGWQDLRTVGTCIALGMQGVHVAPNASVSKLAYLLDITADGRARAAGGDLLFGTPDTWLAWHLTGEHVVDPTQAATTGMFSSDTWSWDREVLDALEIPAACLPRVVATSGMCGEWSGAPVAALVGDQQASLVGQGCVDEGDAKVTIGTGGMVDVTGGAAAPSRAGGSWRGDDGTYPIVAWDVASDRRFGAEAIILSAGDAIAWLVDLGLLTSVEECESVARSVPSSDGVFFVPALAGLGSPHFDFGARGAFTGLTRGATRAHLVRAVVEGVAHRIADAVEAAGLSGPLRVDGGAAANRLLLESVSTFTGLPVHRAPVTDATSLGAALWAGVAIGVWPSASEARRLWPPQDTVEPSPSDARDARDGWAHALDAARRWLPDFSDLPL